MKKIILVLAAALAVSVQISAQTADDFKKRYENLVGRVGVAGVGVEGLLDKWSAVDSTSVDYLFARFAYDYYKSQSTEVVTKPTRKYLGADPVLTLKDSTGTDIYYFQDILYDDEYFSQSMTCLDKAIKLYPERLDLRETKISALVNYEKESPDMALSYILDLIDENASGARNWEYPGFDNVDNVFFGQLIADYSSLLFSTVATPQSRNAFKTISEKMLTYDKKNADLISNLGSYCMVMKDYKQALKYFDKALKINPEHYASIKNSVNIATVLKDKKLQKKYLPMLIRTGSEAEKLAAQARLDTL